MTNGVLREFSRGLVGMAAVLSVLGMVAAAFAVVALHLTVAPILTGSMSPTFDPGAAVLTRQIPREAIRAGDVIVFRPPGHTSSYAHRVVTVTEHAGAPVLITRGDANPSNDPWKAELTAPVAQQVVFSVPLVGRAIVALHQPGAQPLALALAGLASLFLGVRAVLGTSRTSLSGPTPSRAG